MSFVPYEDRRPVKRRTLDRDQVVAAALALLDEVGLDALTMRLLAARLGVKAASLYRHVRDKEELLILLADAVSATAEDVDPALPWRKRLTTLAFEYRRALTGIRDGARLLAETPPAGPNRLRKVDETLGAILASGCTPQDAAKTSFHFNNLIVSFAADEARFAAWGDRTAKSPEELAEMKRAFARALRVDLYPNLAPLAEFAGTSDLDAIFTFGIELFLDGLEARIARTRERR